MQKKLLSKEKDFFNLPNLKLFQLDFRICLPFGSDFFVQNPSPII